MDNTDNLLEMQRDLLRFLKQLSGIQEDRASMSPVAFRDLLHRLSEIEIELIGISILRGRTIVQT